ncbi:MAG: glycosyltransferase [Deltaproteobacteria bacterium]|nr:glycosyltransferase [Deltaproteobacteria bacterium]MBW2106065.1 glycosyltransferase [Deltaproteobacteria bacterium]
MFEHEVNPDNIKKATFVVAIPSYNEADSIAFPVQQADQGIQSFFRDIESVIINCDNNSDDGTKEIFLGIKTAAPKIYISTEPGVKGKGRNFKNLFKKIVDLKAEGVVVVDADLKSITPKWIKHLGEPLFQDFGYVAPLYVRHKYDGTITNSIAYPLTRSLYGRRIRQPIGGDFGFCGKLAQIYLQSDTWTEAIANFGIDIWMTTLAMNENIPICQAFMGRPKIHRAKDPGADLGPMFRQVVGTIFHMMIKFYPFWSKVKWSKPTSIFGFGLGETEMPPPVKVNKEILFTKFQNGFNRCVNIWEKILQKETVNKLQEIKKMNKDQFDFPTNLWINVLIDFTIAYRDKLWMEDELLDSLIPIYLGKTLSYVKKTERMSIRDSEEFIEEECIQFEATKKLLLKRWESKPN